MEFLKSTLKNGLEIVAECNDRAHSSAVGFFVKTGARDESDEVSGVSHFLEHMVFKGTPSRTADDVNRQFDEMGAQYNAFTSEENTVFYAAVLPEYEEASVELLADILRPSLREEDFNTEKQVILEEISMYEDQPPFGADEKCRAAHFGPTGLGRSILGTAQSITELSVDAMRGYFRRRYSPGNIALVGAGRIDFDRLVATAERCAGDWEPVDNGRDISATGTNNAFQLIHKETATQQYVVRLTDGPSAESPGRYPAKLLATVLGDDTGSRLYWELIDPGLAEQAGLAHYEYDGTGIFMTYLTCEPDDAAENLDRVLAIYREAEAAGITATELNQAKSKISSRIVLSGERPRNRLFAVGGEWVQRRAYCSIRDDLDTVAAITLDDIAAVLGKHPLTRGTTVAIGPLEGLAEPK